MRLSILLLVLFFSCATWGQIGTGQWRLHTPSNNAVDIAEVNGTVHCAMQNQLISYNVDAGEKTVRNNINYLSDNQITALGEDTENGLLFIGYSTGNIDVLDGEEISNFPFIVTSQITGSKLIYSIKAYRGLVYVATGFGIVVIDPDKMEVRDTYFPTSGNDPVHDLAFNVDTIFALGANTLYKANVNNPFLADASLWEEDNRLIDYDGFGEYTDLQLFNNKLYAAFNHTNFEEDTVFNLTNSSKLLTEIELEGLDVSSNLLLVSSYGAAYTYNSDETLKESIFQFDGQAFPNVIASLFYDGFYYLADKDNGFVKAQNSFSSSYLNVEGPADSKTYKLDWQDNRLVVVSGGLSGENPSFNNAGVYVFYEEKWTNITKDNQPALEDKEIWDFLSLAINPKDASEFAVGTYSKLPIFLVGEDANTVVETYDNMNSYLEPTSLGNTWTYVSGMNYDSKGNLWVANSYANRPLKVLGENGFWYDFELPNAAKNKFTRDILVDYNDIKWLSIKEGGLLAFSEGEDLDDTSDDKIKFFNTGETTGALPINDVTAMAVDFDNEIWIGTPKGLRILYNSESALDAGPGDYNFQKLVIEFGENNEEVFINVDITDIEVDGANRKWIATADAGLFLFSEDGLEIISEFNTDNSPLISNEIIDIEIDQNTGEVFISTNAGLCSYRGDATYGDAKYENVVVFPNPVLPRHSGVITMQGIAFDSDVKITDVSGNLVYKTRSNGGTATWDGRTLTGERVSTGVYLIWTAPNNGKGRKVGKVVFIN